MRPRSLIMLSTALVLGCTSGREAPPAEDQAAVHLFQSQRQDGYAASRARAMVAQADEVALTEIPEVGISTLPDIGSNMIMRTATASVQVDSLEPAVALVRELATRLGGYVGSSGIVTGKNQLRQAAIEVKVPAVRFDEVLSGLTPIGKLESVNVTAQDVGEEFVDVTARMDNARRLEQRLIGLLATRTGKLKDVLDVERELARVREEIDRYEGRLRYLKAHTAMSTLSVTVHEPSPIVGTAGKSVMGEAFTQAWRNFVALLSLAVQSLGVVLPLGVIALTAWFVSRRWRLRGA